MYIDNIKYNDNKCKYFLFSEDEDCSDAEYCGISECLVMCERVCGLNADCAISNHSAVCSCLLDYTDDDSSVFCHKMGTLQLFEIVLLEFSLSYLKKKIQTFLNIGTTKYLMSQR